MENRMHPGKFLSLVDVCRSQLEFRLYMNRCKLHRRSYETSWGIDMDWQELIDTECFPHFSTQERLRAAGLTVRLWRCPFHAMHVQRNSLNMPVPKLEASNNKRSQLQLIL